MKPFVSKVFYPFGAILVKTGRYLEDVWSKLNTSDRGVLFSSIFLIITCRCDFSSSLRRDSEIGTLPVVLNLLTNFILLNKFCVQLDWFKSTWLRFISGWILIRALVTVTAMVLQITPPRPRTTYNKKVCFYSRNYNYLLQNHPWYSGVVIL